MLPVSVGVGETSAQTSHLRQSSPGSDIQSSVSTVPAPLKNKGPQQKRGKVKEAESISDGAWNCYDDALRQRIYRQNGTFHIPQTVAFRCKDKRAWTTKCNKTCVTGSGDVPRLNLVHFIGTA